MKKLLFLLLAVLLPMMASAQECIDGIYYEKTSDGTYKVVKHSTAFYSGEITIPSTANGIKVTEIGDNAFFDNQNLTAVHLPITIEKIGIGAFGNCDNLHSIEIPDNVNYIDAYAFGGIDNLTDVYCYANNLSLGEDIFYKTKVKSITLHVPETNLLYFKKADQWKKIKNLEATTTTSWAVQQQEREIAEQKRIAEEREREAKRIAEEQAKARQKAINDSIAARQKAIKDSIEARQKFTNDSLDAIQGNVDAQLRMAKRYEEGDGVDEDINIALDYYRKLGNNGNVEAQLHLGDLYFAGNGVDKDEKVAMEWYRKAANAGNADAQYNLGRMYYYGEGVNKDIKTAMVWINKSAAQGNAYAKIQKQRYTDDYCSYWHDSDHWRMVLPNGVIVVRSEERAKIETNTFRVEVDNNTPNEEDFNKILNGKSKFNAGIINAFGFLKYNIFVKESEWDRYKALTDIQKNALLKKETSVISFDPSISTQVGYKVSGFWESEGTFQNGKYVSLKTKLASLTKRFGFNPENASHKRIFTPGRSAALIDDFVNYLREAGKSDYSFTLLKNNGSARLLRIYYSGSGSRIGSMWVNGGKITSVTWFY